VSILITIVNLFSQLLTLLVLAQALMSYFVSPYHPVRQTLDRLLEPVYAPIRRLIPPMGMLDLSPMVLIILVQIVSRLLVGLLVTL